MSACSKSCSKTRLPYSRAKAVICPTSSVPQYKNYFHFPTHSWLLICQEYTSVGLMTSSVHEKKKKSAVYC